MIEDVPKSILWKIRTSIGQKVKCYNDIEEFEGVGHRSNLGEE